MAGFVDVVGYIAVYRLFTAHVTGAMAHLGIDLVTQNVRATLIVLGTISSFVAGAIVARIAIETGARMKRTKVASFNLAVEGAALIISAILQPHGAATLALLGFAMGLQSATLTRIGEDAIHTTFVTGMLDALSRLIAQIAFYTHDLWHPASSSRTSLQEKRARRVRHVEFIVALLLTYVAGAAAGVLLSERFGVRSLLCLVPLLLIAIAVDQFHRLSLEELAEQVGSRHAR